MAVYAVTGKLGSGKGKAAIQKMREYLREGKRVATNCDVFLEHMDHSRSRGTVIRVPDKPTATDLYMIGSGNRFIEFEPNIQHTKDGLVGAAPLKTPKMLPGFDECHNGALFLDELGSWFNTRNFQDKGRASLLEWFIHARKYGWDIYFIMQNVSQVDKQLRDSLFEYVVRLSRLDRMKVPFVSALVKLGTAGAFSGALPRMHIAVVRLGALPDGLVADRWFFRGDDLHSAYNTVQVFSDSYPHGTHTLISPWHLSCKTGLPVGFVGPVRPGAIDDILLRERTLPLKPLSPHMTKFLLITLCFGLIVGAVGARFYWPSGVRGSAVAGVADRVYSERLIGVGLMSSPRGVSVTLSDGRTVTPLRFSPLSGGGWEAQISPSTWVRSAL